MNMESASRFQCRRCRDIRHTLSLFSLYWLLSLRDFFFAFLPPAFILPYLAFFLPLFYYFFFLILFVLLLLSSSRFSFYYFSTPSKENLGKIISFKIICDIFLHFFVFSVFDKFIYRFCFVFRMFLIDSTFDLGRKNTQDCEFQEKYSASIES